MSAAPHFFDEPPLVSPAPLLTVLPGADVENRLSRAETLTRNNEHSAALEQLDALWLDVHDEAPLVLRHRLATAWATMYEGRLEDAAALLAQADAIVQSPHFDAADRASVLYRTGCVALKRGEVAEAVSLFTRALETNIRSSRPSSLLAADVRNWRSRCYQLLRDWDAAGRDAEASLELATEAGCERTRADAMFQASLVAERQRQWLLARFHAEQALEIYRRYGDTLSTARLLNNLGGIDFLLGDVESRSMLVEAARLPPSRQRRRRRPGHLFARTGAASAPPARSRRATSAEAGLALLEGRLDFLERPATRSSSSRSRYGAPSYDAGPPPMARPAERTFIELGMTSHSPRSGRSRRPRAGTGDCDAAAELYRDAAEALQDFHF